MISTRLKVTFITTAILLTGCWRQPAGEFQPITLEADNVAGKVDYSGLAAVLKDAVTADGKLLPKKLKANAKMLDGQLMIMTVAGPKTRPDLFDSEHAKLNYWYNVRAAWSLRLLLTFSRERQEPDTDKTIKPYRWEIAGDGVSIEDFNNRPFPIDGRSMTLALIDSLIIDQFGFKAVIGAPGVSPLRAAIPAKPFEAADAGKLIDKRFNGFVDSEQRFVIDAASKRILVPPILWRFAERLITDHQQKYRVTGANLTTALLPHVRLSPHRRLQDAVGYTCTGASAPKVSLIVKRTED
ncbi:MAG: hypothetical protein GY794_26350 [bacterium]|nr:hypothetical protein [bacterium]